MNGYASAAFYDDDCGATGRNVYAINLFKASHDDVFEIHVSTRSKGELGKIKPIHMLP